MQWNNLYHANVKEGITMYLSEYTFFVSEEVMRMGKVEIKKKEKNM